MQNHERVIDRFSFSVAEQLCGGVGKVVGGEMLTVLRLLLFLSMSEALWRQGYLLPTLFARLAFWLMCCATWMCVRVGVCDVLC